MEKEKLPTAEDILKQEVLKVTNGMDYEHNVTHAGIIKAMEEYKDLHTAPLQARIDELEKQLEDTQYWCRRWKDDLTALQDRQPEIDANAFSCAVAEYEINADEVKVENKRLREALEEIEWNCKRVAEFGLILDIIRKYGIAKEALKGGDNE